MSVLTAPAEIDRNALLALADGNVEFLRELVGIFRLDAPDLLERIRAAIAAGDATALRRAAHTLTGNAGILGAPGVAALARDLEALGRDGQLAGAPAILRELDAALTTMCQGLLELMAELSPIAA